MWDSKAEALAKETREEEERERAVSDRALGLEGGPQGPAIANAKAELEELSEKSRRRQEFIDWSNSREVSITHGPQEGLVELPASVVAGKALRLSESEGVTYVLPAGVIKVMVDKCRRLHIRAPSSITTSTIELYACADVDVELSQPLGTLQVDECVAPVRVSYADRDHVGRIYHQNSPGLCVSWGGPGCSFQSPGVAGAVQLCTHLGLTGAEAPLVTEAVQRDAREYPADLASGTSGAPPGAAEQQPPQAAPDDAQRRRLAEQHRQTGNDMFRANDFMQATVHYTESLQLDPAVGAVWANRAQSWLKLADHDKALRDATRCTEVDPANPKGWVRKGMSLHAMERFPEAVPALLEAERLEPKSQQVVDAIKMTQLMARKYAAGA